LWTGQCEGVAGDHDAQCARHRPRGHRLEPELDERRSQRRGGGDERRAVAGQQGQGDEDAAERLQPGPLALQRERLARGPDGQDGDESVAAKDGRHVGATLGRRARGAQPTFGGSPCDVRSAGARLAGARPHEPGLVGEHDGLDPALHPELAQQPGDVGLDGRLAEEELAAHRRVGHAPREEPQDLGLALGELLETPSRVLVGLGPVEEVLDQAVRDRRVE
jgi:hypothetical protein